jgi:hypothetical protein
MAQTSITFFLTDFAEERSPLLLFDMIAPTQLRSGRLTLLVPKLLGSFAGKLSTGQEVGHRHQRQTELTRQKLWKVPLKFETAFLDKRIGHTIR